LYHGDSRSQENTVIAGGKRFEQGPVQLTVYFDNEGLIIGEKRGENGKQKQQDYETQPAKCKLVFGELAPDHFAV
jgi:hypothetical protein